MFINLFFSVNSFLHVSTRIIALFFIFVGVGGPSIDIEKQLYAPEELEPLSPCSSPSPNPGAVPSTSINITVASPNSSILKGSAVSLRRGSGNNNTNNATSFSGATSR